MSVVHLVWFDRRLGDPARGPVDETDEVSPVHPGARVDASAYICARLRHFVMPLFSKGRVHLSYIQSVTARKRDAAVEAGKTRYHYACTHGMWTSFGKQKARKELLGWLKDMERMMQHRVRRTRRFLPRHRLS
jgi:hypothetical protein